MLKMCVFFGCQLLFERNKGNIKDYFTQRGYGHFLMYLPDEKEPGIYAGTQTHQELCESTEEFINNKIDKCLFKNLIQQWLEFDIGDTEKYDEAMGAGWTLVAAKSKFKVKDRQESLPNIRTLFKTTKIKAW
jgi:hypothetical protein